MQLYQKTESNVIYNFLHKFTLCIHFGCVILKEHFILKFIIRFFMTNIRELSFDEIAIVSGGEGHGSEVNRDKRDARNARNSLIQARPYNGPTYIYSDPSTVKCADAVFGGMIGGAIKGGVVGMARGTIGGAITGQCLSGGGNGNGNGSKAGSSNCSGSNVGGTCSR
ncbi:hypothetical protein [Klebsiella indica]|uniref:hypothetical protein n=1 Tax=Klebsiella indica TaxID=2582917 RepID=UPI001F4FA269|nr:hypothetical protein [Klebsiella indica]